MYGCKTRPPASPRSPYAAMLRPTLRFQQLTCGRGWTLPLEISPPDVLARQPASRSEPPHIKREAPRGCAPGDAVPGQHPWSCTEQDLIPEMRRTPPAMAWPIDPSWPGLSDESGSAPYSSVSFAVLLIRALKLGSSRRDLKSSSCSAYLAVTSPAFSANSSKRRASTLLPWMASRQARL